jgi:hypothetical protein
MYRPGQIIKYRWFDALVIVIHHPNYKGKHYEEVLIVAFEEAAGFSDASYAYQKGLTLPCIDTSNKAQR